MESPGIASAESKTSRKPPKVLDHIRVSRSLDGGHVMEHHYTSFDHAPRAYKFPPGEQARAREHVLRHAGLSVKGGGANSAAVVEDEE